MQKRIQYAIGLLSISIIAFQIILIQILSIVQWYHFAYMVISVALLGFGAAGTFLSLYREKILFHSEWLLPTLMILSGLFMSVVVRISQIEFFRFDTYLLFADSSHIWRLLVTYLIYVIPFFLAALAIGIVFVKFSDSIGKLYFYNLVGSGIGGIAVIGLIWQFFPEELPAIISIIPLISGIVIISRKSKIILISFALVTSVFILFNLVYPQRLILSEFKSYSRTMNLPDAGVTWEKNSPFGFMQLVTSPALRFAPGLSLTFTDTVAAGDAIFNNGDWFGPIIHPAKIDTPDFLDYTTLSLPYIISKKEKVLILESGTGYRVRYALTEDAGNITAVESNPLIISLLENGLTDESDFIYSHPKVTLHNSDVRTFLQSDTLKYDLITFPIIGSFGGNSGLYALQEKYNLTKDAFHQVWDKLNANGVLSITCWMDYPARNPLKILAAIVETMEEEGIKNPSDHISGVRSWGTITFTVKKSKLTPDEILSIRNFCDKMSFDVSLLPGIEEAERNKYNLLQDDNFFIYLDKIIDKDRIKFYSEYPFNIQPAVDDRPYFSQFFKLTNLQNLRDNFGSYSIPYFEVGYFIVILTFIQIAIAAFLLIILPLFKLGWKGGNKLWTLSYFSGIGLGYMFVEIVLINRFILYFGNPIYSAAAIISSMLICSGIGSYFSYKYKLSRKSIRLIFGLIILSLILYSFLLTPILNLTISFSFILKLLFALLIISPLSFLMGFPFPSGITYLNKKSKIEIPWALGINGCFSVVSTVLATIISIELGFTWVMFFAAFAYCLPLFANSGK